MAGYTLQVPARDDRKFATKGKALAAAMKLPLSQPWTVLTAAGNTAAHLDAARDSRLTAAAAVLPAAATWGDALDDDLLLRPEVEAEVRAALADADAAIAAAAEAAPAAAPPLRRSGPTEADIRTAVRKLQRELTANAPAIAAVLAAPLPGEVVPATGSVEAGRGELAGGDVQTLPRKGKVSSGSRKSGDPRADRARHDHAADAPPAPDTQVCTGACARSLPLVKFPTTKSGRGSECRTCRDTRRNAAKAAS